MEIIYSKLPQSGLTRHLSDFICYVQATVLDEQKTKNWAHMNKI